MGASLTDSSSFRDENLCLHNDFNVLTVHYWACQEPGKRAIENSKSKVTASAIARIFNKESFFFVFFFFLLTPFSSIFLMTIYAFMRIINFVLHPSSQFYPSRYFLKEDVISPLTLGPLSSKVEQWQQRLPHSLNPWNWQYIYCPVRALKPLLSSSTHLLLQPWLQTNALMSFKSLRLMWYI